MTKSLSGVSGFRSFGVSDDLVLNGHDLGEPSDLKRMGILPLVKTKLSEVKNV